MRTFGWIVSGGGDRNPIRTSGAGYAADDPGDQHHYGQDQYDSGNDAGSGPRLCDADLF